MPGGRATGQTAWAAWLPATCLPHGCFCEAIRSGWVAQPANTWSSIAFVLAGATILWLSFRASQPGGFGKTHRRVFGIALIVVGLGSAFYHASLTFIGQIFDVQGMYLLGTFVLLYGLSRSGHIDDRVFVWLYILINCVLLFAQAAAPGARRYLFAGLLLGVIGVETRSATATGAPQTLKLFYAAIASMAAALAVWVLDITRKVCVPASLMQGHAIWHILGALSAVLLYLHYARTATVKVGQSSACLR